MDISQLDIKEIKGVGPQRAKILNKLGIHTVEDLLLYVPREYKDLSRVMPLCSYKENDELVSKVRVRSQPKIIRVRAKMEILKVIVSDQSGKAVCIWYNQSFLKQKIRPNIELLIWGKVKYQYNEMQIINPSFHEIKGEMDYPKMIPIYPLAGNLTQKIIQGIIRNALLMTNNQLKDPLPESFRREYRLAELNYALYHIHFPLDRNSLENARKRLVFEEFFYFCLALKMLRNQYKDENRGISFSIKKEIMEDFLSHLPFTLTQGQRNVFCEILEDMKRECPMNRLLQGDVGSGKTVLAAAALFIAAINRYQGAFMVPTEILAKQHYAILKKIFHGYDIQIGILEGSMTKKKREEAIQAIQEGKWDIVIGTHALIQDDVSFYRLGLVITDEQHRFGVRQRAQLSQKGITPDVLVISATPIPRTLGLILYGDLDISIIRELPPGRKPVKTYHIPPQMRERMYHFVQQEIRKGRQAYVVCPLVDPSEHITARSAEEIHRELVKRFPRDIKIGLVHGKLKNDEKDFIMEEFQEQRIHLLVATTVIEVGVNIPNATIMVIENADRFGLAQLHQLRGRVGRGDIQSYCFLVSEAPTKEAQKRMAIMTGTNDGFIIAEEDFKMRGPGDFLGVRQHGLPDFKVANIFSDMEILKETQKVVDMIFNEPEKYDIQSIGDTAVQRFFKHLDGIVLN
ncbi:MAG: ATP-dependent DNA helicase RecG [Clostridia bacterium]|jgi:ATP-dependent DNA helicase RecG